MRDKLEHALQRWRDNPQDPAAAQAVMSAILRVAQSTVDRIQGLRHSGDVAWDSATKCWEHIRQDKTQPGSELGFISTVARRDALKALKAQREDPVDDIEATSMAQDRETTASAEAHLARRLDLQRLRSHLPELLEALPASQRYVITRHYIDELGLDEITQECLDTRLDQQGLQEHATSHEQRAKTWRTAQNWVAKNHERGLKHLLPALQLLMTGE